MNLCKFLDMYGGQLSCPNIYGKYGNLCGNGYAIPSSISI